LLTSLNEDKDKDAGLNQEKDKDAGLNQEKDKDAETLPVFNPILGLSGCLPNPAAESSDGAASAKKESARLVYDKLDQMLDVLMNPLKKTDEVKTDEDMPLYKIVLLFDESRVLLQRHYDLDAFLFRCIRMWIREKRIREQVVPVFTGTNSRLANFFVESSNPLVSQDGATGENERGDPHVKGERLNPPFFQTTTMGCFHDLENKPPSSCEYDAAVYYGRPLFAMMATEENLEKNMSTVFRRTLLMKDGDIWYQNLLGCIHLLCIRIQMGQTSLKLTSDLVARGYANLTGFTVESGIAQLACLPDPVCARIAMCMMDGDFKKTLSTVGSSRAVIIRGREKHWWTEKLKEIFSNGIVSPEKGDFGEVMVALYMLFCGDVLRKKLMEDKDPKPSPTSISEGGTHDPKIIIDDSLFRRYDYFSVSLDEWLYTLNSGGKLPSSTATQENCNGRVSVGFIQVCRNSLRSYGASWESLFESAYLEYIYKSGTAFYVYPGCPVIDLVIPLRLETTTDGITDIGYAPMFVSIKCHQRFCDTAVDQVLAKMLTTIGMTPDPKEPVKEALDLQIQNCNQETNVTSLDQRKTTAPSQGDEKAATEKDQKTKQKPGARRKKAAMNRKEDEETKAKPTSCKKDQETKKRPALCVLIIFGENPPARKKSTKRNTTEEAPRTLAEFTDVRKRLIAGEVVHREIRVPHNDDFNLCAAFRALKPTAQANAELFASHPFLKGHGDDEELEASKALRATSSGIFVEHYNALRTAVTSRGSLIISALQKRKAKSSVDESTTKNKRQRKQK